MTRYAGVKALDAEIILNLVEGTVTMDYSLNKLGNPLQSNFGAVLESEWKSQSLLTRLLYILRVTGLLLIHPFFAFVIVLFTFLTERKLITNPKWQYNYQRFYAWIDSNIDGKWEQSQTGALKDTRLTFPIWSNLFLEYELTGDYKDKIKSISLLRNFQTHWRFDKFKEITQKGWNVVFEFTDPPQSGSCTVWYV
jgi:hypothetical protein